MPQLLQCLNRKVTAGNAQPKTPKGHHKIFLSRGASITLIKFNNVFHFFLVGEIFPATASHSRFSQFETIVRLYIFDKIIIVNTEISLTLDERIWTPNLPENHKISTKTAFRIF